MNTVVYVADVTLLKNKYYFNRAKELIPKEEIEKLNNIKSDKQRLLSFGARALLYFAVKDLFIVQPKMSSLDGGKPYFYGSDLKFNFTHSGEKVALILSENEVGIDIEKLRKVNLKVADRYFCQNEIRNINSSVDKDKCFFSFWTKKESLLKTTGTGIKGGLSSADLTKNSGKYCFLDGKKYYFCEYDLEGYSFTCCSSDNDFPNKFVQIDFDKI